MKITKTRGAAVLATLAVIGGGAGAAIAGGTPLLGGSDDRAESLAEALNESAGTQLSADQVEQALEQLREDRVAEAVASGRITQEQADQREAFHVQREATSAAVGAALEGFLGSSIDEIRDAVKDGTSIAEQAEAAGKTRDGAVSAVVGALTTARDSAPDKIQERLTDERIQEMAERTVDSDGSRRGGPDHRGGGHHGFGGDGPRGGHFGGGPDAPVAPEADGDTQAG